MIYFLLILIVIVMIFGREAGCGFLIVSGIIFLIVLAIAIIIHFTSQNNSNSTTVSQPITTQNSQNNIIPCAGNIADLSIIQTTYKTYNLYDYDSSIGTNENAVEQHVLIKNNSTCEATEVDWEVDLLSKKNPDIEQTETFNTNFTAVGNGSGALMPQQTQEYSNVFDAFDSFIYKEAPYGDTVTKSSLSSDAKITTKIISAEWSSPTQQ